MRYKIFTLALLFILSFTLTACSLQELPVIGKYFGGLGGSKEATLTMWGLWEDPDVIGTAISAYKEKNPKITINYEDRSVLKADDYRVRVAERADENIDADIVLVHNSWVPRIKDKLAPMPSGMSAKEYQEAFYPVAAQSALLDNKIYAMPLYYDGLVLLYNKDHFSEIGQQDPPTSWTEFQNLANRLTVKAGEEDKLALVRAGAAIGNSGNIEHFSDIIGLLMSQTDVKIPDDLASKPAADALDYYISFVSLDRLWDSSMPEANTAFAQGKVSMIFVPSWRILDILAANPDLNFGVAPVPQALPETPANWASFWMLAVPSSSKNQAVAWDFIKFITSEEQELSLFSEASKYRPFGTPFARVSLASQLENNPYLAAVVQGASTAKSGELAARAGNTKAVNSLSDAVSAVLNKKVDSLAALKNLLEGKPQPKN